MDFPTKNLVTNFRSDEFIEDTVCMYSDNTYLCIYTYMGFVDYVMHVTGGL